jgi:hypothetical protein
MQLAPVTAAQQQAAAAAAAAEGGSAVQRTPVFELQVLLTQSLEDLAFDPEPEQFQVSLCRVQGALKEQQRCYGDGEAVHRVEKHSASSMLHKLLHGSGAHTCDVESCRLRWRPSCLVSTAA